LELFDYEAHFYSESTFCTLPIDIDGCINSKRASPRHRLAAATLAMINADNHGDSVKAVRVYESISQLTPTDDRQRIDVLTIAAVFHASFGDVTRVAGLLTDLVELTRKVRQPVLRAVLLRRASWGICRFSPRVVAREVLNEAISVFERLSLTDQLIICFEHLCLIDLQEGDYPAVEETLRRIQEVAVESPTFYARAVEFEMRQFLAFETQSLKPLENFVVPTSALDPFRHAARGRMKLAALQLADHLMRGSDSDVKKALGVLEELHLELRIRCDQDFVIAFMTSAYLRLGKRSRADRLLSDDLHGSRREPDFLMPSLVRLAEELETPQKRGSGAQIPTAS
jgi:hypothetical protein